MFAVVKTGGKQYRVAKDDVIKVERLTAEPGSTVTLDRVLAVQDGEAVKVGAPFVEGAAVAAEVVEQGRADKIIVFKKKRRKNYRRKRGHRQHETVLRVTEILLDGAKPAAKAPAKKAAAKKAEAKKAGAKKATAKKAAAKKAAPAKGDAADAGSED